MKDFAQDLHHAAWAGYAVLLPCAALELLNNPASVQNASGRALLVGLLVLLPVAFLVALRPAVRRLQAHDDVASARIGLLLTLALLVTLALGLGGPLFGVLWLFPAAFALTLLPLAAVGARGPEPMVGAAGAARPGDRAGVAGRHVGGPAGRPVALLYGRAQLRLRRRWRRESAPQSPRGLRAA